MKLVLELAQDRAELGGRAFVPPVKERHLELVVKAAGQLERSYAAEKGYRIIEELAEDERGASGAEIDLPQLDRVRGSGRYPAPLFH